MLQETKRRKLLDTELHIFDTELHLLDTECMSVFEDALDALSDTEHGSPPDRWDSALDGLSSDDSPPNRWDSALDGLSSDECEDGGSAIDEVAALVPFVSEVSDGIVPAPVQDGPDVVPPLILQVLQKALTQEETGSVEAVIAKDLCTNSALESHVSSVSRLDVTLREHSETQTLTAACGLSLEIFWWHQLERDLDKFGSGRQDVRWRLFVEFQCYDGVELPLISEGLCEMKLATGASSSASALAAADPYADMVALDGAVASVIAAKGMKNSKKHKVLQSESHTLMVMEVGGELHVLSGDELNWLQLSDRATAECLCDMQQSSREKTSFREKFERKVRFTVTDRFSANKLTEREMMARKESSGSANWSLLHLFCIPHILASLLKDMMKKYTRFIDGLRSFGKSLAAVGEMDKFRDCFVSVLKSKLRLMKWRRLTRSEILFKMFIISSFFRGKTSCALLVTIKRCLPGPWDSTVLEYYVDDGSDTTEQDVLQLWQDWLVPCFIGHVPHLWPTGKWTGYEISLKDVGVFLIGALLADSFRLYMSEHHASEIPKAPGAQLALEDDNVDSGAASSAKATEDSGNVAAEENKNSRAVTSRWISEGLHLYIPVIAKCTRPSTTYMNQELDASSHTWSVMQWARNIKPAQQQGLEQLLHGRDWALLDAACGVRDRQLMEALRELQNPAEYTGLPSQLKTVENRHFIFKIVSFQGSYAHEKLELPHTLPPYSLLVLAKHPDRAACFRHQMMCEFLGDDYSLQFYKYFESHGGVDGYAARLELSIMIIIGKNTTSHLESLNGYLRRLIRLRQTNPMRFIELCEKFILARVKAREARLNYPAYFYPKKKRVNRKSKGKKKAGGTSSAQSAKSKVRKTAVKGGRRGGGGAWRAFVRKRCTGVADGLQKIIKDVAAEYKQIKESSPDEFAELKALGSAASVSHRMGSKAFGPKASGQSRAETFRAAVARVSAQAALEDGLAVDGHQRSLACSPAAARDMVQEARADDLVVAKLRRMDKRDSAERTIGWNNDGGAAKRNAAVTAVPPLAKYCHGIQCKPCPFVQSWMDWTCPIGTIVPAIVDRLSCSENRADRDQVISWFRQQVKTTYHKDAKPVHDDSRKKTHKKPCCRDALICLCFAVGTAAWIFKKRINFCMRRWNGEDTSFNEFVDAGASLIERAEIYGRRIQRRAGGGRAGGGRARGRQGGGRAGGGRAGDRMVNGGRAANGLRVGYNARPGCGRAGGLRRGGGGRWAVCRERWASGWRRPDRGWQVASNGRRAAMARGRGGHGAPREWALGGGWLAAIGRLAGGGGNFQATLCYVYLQSAKKIARTPILFSMIMCTYLLNLGIQCNQASDALWLCLVKKRHVLCMLHACCFWVCTFTRLYMSTVGSGRLYEMMWPHAGCLCIDCGMHPSRLRRCMLTMLRWSLHLI